MSQKSILEIKDLVLNLGEKRILDHLSLEIWPGHIHAVVGPNGAGKSTLANTIMGLKGYLDFDGDILFTKKTVKEFSVDERARQGITMAWQEPARYEGLTVRSFIRAGADDKSEQNCRHALELVGLDPKTYLSRAVDRTLSGGERKRIELASILTMEPKLVLMDEPDSGIDVEALEKIFDAIQYLKNKGTTILLITHSTTVLEKADHAFLICCGQLIEKGSVDKIMQYFGQKCIPCDHKNEPKTE
ncbi:ATP-binding cassette domain-containing protein [candidate division KSB1 bacterium]|nr:ATP-binding cassette domain-containing protein [candidate division KSB1 bacterium]